MHSLACAHVHCPRMQESKYWMYVSDSDAESLEPEPAPDLGCGKRQRKIKIR